MLTALCVSSAAGIAHAVEKKRAKKVESGAVTEVAKDAVEKPLISPQLGHSSIVEAVSFSPDGRTIVSGSGDRTLKLWDTASGRELRTLNGHTDNVRSVAFSLDGRTIVSVSGDNTIKLWDTASGRELRTLSERGSSISAVAFSANGSKMVSCRQDKTINIWDVGSGRELFTLRGHSDVADSVAFSPDGHKIVTGHRDNTLILWDATSGRKLRTMGQINPVQIHSVAFSPDGRTAVSGDAKHTIKLWDTTSGRELRTLRGHNNRVVSVAFSPDGRRIITGSFDNTLKLWDSTSGRELRSFRGHSGLVFVVAFSPDGRTIVSGSEDKTLKLWDATSGRELRTLSGHSETVRALAVTPNGHIISNTDDFTIKLWDSVIGSQQIYTLSGQKDKVNAVSFSPDGNTVVLNNGDTLKLWSTANGKELHSLIGRACLNSTIASSSDGGGMITVSAVKVRALAFSVDGKIVAGCNDSTLKIWDSVSGIELYTFSGNNNSNSSLKFWDEANRQEMRTLSGHSAWVSAIIFSPDGSTIVSSSGDNTLKIWDAGSGRELRTLIGHSSPVLAAAFSPDGHIIASGSRDSTIKLWNVANGSELFTIGGQGGSISTLVFSHDGHAIISGSNDNSLIIWDVGSGKELLTLKGHSGVINSATFDPEGKYLFSASQDGTVRQWDIKTGKEIAQFVSFSDGEWITITPDGYYNSSLNGHKYLNISNGTKVYGIDQFYDVFYRPDIVQAKLRGEDINPLISITIDDAIKSPPPVVKVTKAPSDTSAPKAQVCYQINSTGGGIGEVRVFQNGKLIKSDGFYRENIANSTAEKRQLVAMNSRAIQDEMRGLVIKEKEKPSFIVAKPKGDTFEECVNLETVPGENEISVTAFNAGNTIQSYMQTTTFNSSRTLEEPHLYILSVGIDKYSDASINLKYAAKDASDFIAKLPEKARGLYDTANIHLETILDDRASRAGILNKIDELSTKIKPGDTFILFVASHGVLVQDQYYIVTSDYDGNLYNTKKLISSNEIVEMSKKIKSLSQLFIFDTCHAGGVDNIISGLYDARMSVMAKKMGLHIYASAGSVQTAMDGYEGNGLYTHTLLQGIANGKEVDKDNSGKVSVKNLGIYTKEKTTEISTKLGHPQTPYIINFGRDNPLFTVK